MVQNIERFRAQLDRLLLSNLESPRQRRIDLNASGPLEIVAAQITVRSERRC